MDGLPGAGRPAARRDRRAAPRDARRRRGPLGGRAARIDEALERDSRERIDDPRFVAALVDVARLAIFAGQLGVARRLLQTATWKLDRTAHESPLYDRVDEVEYLLSELGEDNDEEPTGFVDWWDGDD